MLRVPKGWLMVVKMMIDWERTNELCAEIGSDGFAEIVELFLDEVEGVVRRLSKQPDPSRFEADLHFLKGGAWNLGFAPRGRTADRRSRPDQKWKA